MRPESAVEFRDMTPADIEDLATRQVKILKNALGLLKPGGKLVYATCSLENAENEQVVNQASAGRQTQSIYRLPGHQDGDGFYASVITS